jgi:exosortase E/protease (VPEID-CTERM system)
MLDNLTKTLAHSGHFAQIHKLLIAQRLTLRAILLVTLLVLELLTLTWRYKVPELSSLQLVFTHDASWATLLFQLSKQIWPAGLWVIGACLLCLLIPKSRFKGILVDWQAQSKESHWWGWLFCHGLAFAAFAGITVFLFADPTDPARLSALGFISWMTCLAATLWFWLLALAPGRFWLGLVRHEHRRLLIGLLLGICAWRIIRFDGPLASTALWDMLTEPTLRLVHWLLGWIYSDLIFQPQLSIVGTASFQVDIRYGCSGIEGITLITLFLGIYFWLFRKELRFPHVFWLIPVGILAIWIANAVRIVTLVVIGTSFSRDVALQGFHSQAGWAALTLVSVGLIGLSHRMRIFSVTPSHAPSAQRLAVALLVPFLVMMAASMVTSLFSSGFDLLYPLRIVVVAAALCYFLKIYARYHWEWTWQATAIGVAVFVLWILSEPDGEASGTALAERLAELPLWAAAVWLLFRVIGSVIIVPLAEELAFRGYLIRKLIAKDFEEVSPGQFAWLSFLISSLLFGLLHDRWIAGTLAGMGYALALYRRGQLGDAVVAHMTTNALIAVVVLVGGRWSLWS